MGPDPVAALEAAKAVVKDDLTGYCTYHGRSNESCCLAWGDDVFYLWFDDEDLKACIDAALAVPWVDAKAG